MSGIVKLGFDLFADDRIGNKAFSLYTDTQYESQVVRTFYNPTGPAEGFLEFTIGNGELLGNDTTWKTKDYNHFEVDGFLVVKSSANPAIEKDIWAEVVSVFMQKQTPSAGTVWRCRFHIRGIQYGCESALYNPYSA